MPKTQKPKHMRTLLAILLINALFIISTKAQTLVEPSLVQWYTLEEAMEKFEEQPRPLMIDMYTDWCGWCKHMMKTTFANPQIAAIINANFYAVRFDAQTTDTITYKGETYVNKEIGQNRPTHELALKLMNNRRAFPTIVYVDKQGNTSPVPGYMNVYQIEPLLYYFAEEAHRNANYDVFEKYFKMSFIPDSVEGVDVEAVTSDSVQWYTFEEAKAKMETEPRMWFVDLYADMSVGANMMERTTYTNPVIAKYLNETYYPVRFNIVAQDTVRLWGKDWVNPGNAAQPTLHQLARFFFQNQPFVLPSTVYLNTNKEILNIIPGYLSPQTIEPMLKYFGEEKYKTVEWQQYINSFESDL